MAEQVMTSPTKTGPLDGLTATSVGQSTTKKETQTAIGHRDRCTQSVTQGCAKIQRYRRRQTDRQGGEL